MIFLANNHQKQPRKFVSSPFPSIFIIPPQKLPLGEKTNGVKYCGPNTPPPSFSPMKWLKRGGGCRSPLLHPSVHPRCASAVHVQRSGELRAEAGPHRAAGAAPTARTAAAEGPEAAAEDPEVHDVRNGRGSLPFCWVSGNGSGGQTPLLGTLLG